MRVVLSALFAVVGLLVLAVGLSTALPTRARLSRIAERPRVHVGTLAEAPEGTRAVFVGSLAGPPGRRAPSGRPAAAWIAWLEETIQDGDSEHTQALCRDHVVDGLSLREGEGKLDVALDWPSIDDWRDAGDAGEGVAVALPKEQQSSGLPRGLPDWCPAARASRGKLTLHEIVLPPGARAAASGCVQHGRVARCGDGLDFLEVEPTPDAVPGRAVSRAIASRGLLVARIGAGLAGALLALTGLLSIGGSRRRLTRATRRS